jgi:hypothetical protein
MAQSHDEIPSRIELVVLACLSQSKPPAEVEIGEVLQQLALPNESVEAARRRAGEILAVFVHRTWVTSDGDTPRRRRRKAVSGPPPRLLTETGKRVLRSAFNLSRVPTWAQVRDKHIPARALGVNPGSEEAEKACTETAMTAAILGARFGIRDAWTPMEVCDAAIADALGMPRGKLTLDRLRAHVLQRGVSGPTDDAPSPEVRGYAGKLAAWIAGKAVGANGAHGTKARMARALARRWVSSETQPLRAPDQAAVPVQNGLVVMAGGAGNTSSIAGAGHSIGAKQPQGGGAVSMGSQLGDGQGALSSPPTQGGGAQSHAGKPGHVEAAPPAGPRAGEAKGNEGAKPAGTPPQPPNGLLEAVREAIPRIGADGRFGEKVYVSAIWRTIDRDRKSGGISLDNFKRWLVSANRDGKLVLARADLIAAMDAKQVSESEINDRGATFHFVLDQRNGASVSQRESHAR